ncbi:hypothetical protein U1Q18_014156 [Sarracenia purpurea var. burkii]
MGTVGEGDTEEDENGGEGGEEAALEQGTVSSHSLATNGRNIEDEDDEDDSEEGESGDDNDEGSDVSDTVNEGKPERSVTHLQFTVKHRENIANRYSFKKPLRCHSCRFLRNPAENVKNSEIKTTKDCNLLRRYSFPITSEDGYSSEPKDEHLGAIQTGFFKQLNALYRFSRPHTVIGTLIGITSVSLLPLESTADLSLPFFVGLLKALVPSVLMNIYIVGLNQLFDVDIDKVNKPNLPLASGEFSTEFGVAIVFACLLMSLAMGIMFQSPTLLFALIPSFLVRSAYSVEVSSTT